MDTNASLLHGLLLFVLVVERRHAKSSHYLRRVIKLGPDGRPLLQGDVVLRLGARSDFTLIPSKRGNKRQWGSAPYSAPLDHHRVQRPWGRLPPDFGALECLRECRIRSLILDSDH